jgi:hypothetical protein
MDWPKEGITYSYEHRGYIRPEKVELWLQKAFGVDKARFVVSGVYPRHIQENKKGGAKEMPIYRGSNVKLTIVFVLVVQWAHLYQGTEEAYSG